ncbi:MAG TPA: 30S ribosomal protein S6 [Candidatus Paceibacterota bacterium]
MTENNNKQHERQDGVNVYELGFHFVPTLSEDEVAVQFSHLKSLIEKKGGTFISEETPRMINLAYEITKTVKAQKKHYSTSYFGWVKFELNSSEINGLDKDAKNFEPMLRHILIATVRENTMSVPRDAAKKETKGASSEEATGNQAAGESQSDKPADGSVQE